MAKDSSNDAHREACRKLAERAAKVADRVLREGGTVRDATREAIGVPGVPYVGRIPRKLKK